MNRFVLLVLCVLWQFPLHAQLPQVPSFPSSIYSGQHGLHHVQGIAVDKEKGFVYYSFTTSLIKTDLQGNVLASVEGLTGHLGCMALNDEDGHIYASLEYKHDVIGQGILNSLQNARNDDDTGFYVAVFEAERITQMHMDANDSGVMKTVYIREAVHDYKATATNGGRIVEHRYGCSGIDGLAIGKPIGKKKGKNVLYVAYGVYGDVARSDNDYQVILCYDIQALNRYQQVLRADNLHTSGPVKPKAKYFVYTGNTNWGVQNMAYDADTQSLLLSVYKGSKPDWDNYTLFKVDASRKPSKQLLKGFDVLEKQPVLHLAAEGILDSQHQVWGWHFDKGSTGICALGNSYFYISHPGRNEQSQLQETTLYLYKWTGDADKPFVKVE